MKKIVTYLTVGLVLFVSGTTLLLIGGPAHKGKALTLAIPGLFISAAYGLTFLQVRKQYLKKNGSDDLLDQ